MKKILFSLAAMAALGTCAATVNMPTGSTVKLSDNSPADDFVLAGGTLELDVAANATQELIGSITGSGEINKTGAGTLIFNGGDTLTSSTTITIGAGYMRFKDFAEAGGAKISCASGSYLGNVSGYSITIPETTEFVQNGVVGLNFQGGQTNNIAAALVSSNGKINVFGAGTAGAAVRFCGTLPGKCRANSGTEHYFNIDNSMIGGSPFFSSLARRCDGLRGYEPIFGKESRPSSSIFAIMRSAKNQTRKATPCMVPQLRRNCSGNLNLFWGGFLPISTSRSPVS